MPFFVISFIFILKVQVWSEGDYLHFKASLEDCRTMYCWYICKDLLCHGWYPIGFLAACHIFTCKHLSYCEYAPDGYKRLKRMP